MEQYIGEIRMFGGSYAPVGWAICNGQKLAISQNEALFSLIGTKYGGDGRKTFALPDFQGRIPLHQGKNSLTGTYYSLGQKGGEELATLSIQQLPRHNHQALSVSSDGSTKSPENAFWAHSPYKQYAASPPDSSMHPDTISSAGENLPHENVMPYLVVNYIISLTGIYPSRS
ncbi:phage tail protein [Filobacillus milosensis]